MPILAGKMSILIFALVEAVKRKSPMQFFLHRTQECLVFSKNA